MHPQTSVFLAEGIVIGAALVLLAALVIALSPLLWTDHMMNYNKPVPTHCSVQAPSPGQPVIVVHCPFWVNY